MKKTVKYVVRIDGKVILNTRISCIEDYPSISKIEYNYTSCDKGVVIRVHSKLDIVDVEKFLATVTNHAVPDYSKAKVQVVSDSAISRWMPFKPMSLDLGIDSYGLVSWLRYMPMTKKNRAIS